MGHPVRKTLSHAVPRWIRPDEAVYFVTIGCDPRGSNQLCGPGVGNPLLESVAFYNVRLTWWAQLVLLMPDHLHMLVSFPNPARSESAPYRDDPEVGCDVPSRRAPTMADVVTAWKRYTARHFSIAWQRDFFDHRLRTNESLRDKAEYILQNPVRKGLIAKAEDWPYVWWPEMPDGRLGEPSLPNPPVIVRRR